MAPGTMKGWRGAMYRGCPPGSCRKRADSATEPRGLQGGPARVGFGEGRSVKHACHRREREALAGDDGTPRQFKLGPLIADAVDHQKTGLLQVFCTPAAIASARDRK